MSKVTSEVIKIDDYRGHGPLVIPAGTRVTSETACGHDPDYNFINDFSWVTPYPDGTRKSGLIHDLAHYGLNVDADKVVQS